VTVKITGIFTYPDQLALQKSAVDIAREQGRVCVLSLYEDFHGWSKDEQWADVSFQEESDAYIKKMAIVCEKKWQELVLMSVGMGFRDFPIEYFQTGELDKAKAWLTE
jgi:hypothetical protein